MFRQEEKLAERVGVLARKEGGLRFEGEDNPDSCTGVIRN